MFGLSEGGIINNKHTLLTILSREENSRQWRLSLSVRSWGHEAGVGWLSRRLETWLLTRSLPQQGQELFSPSQANLGMRCVTSPHWCHIPGSPGSFQIFTIYVITPERHYGFPRIFAIAGVILQQKIQRLDYFSTFYLIILSKKSFLSLINVWIRRMRAAGRAGGSVCLIRYWRCYRSSVCDTHSILGTRDDGMAR